MDGVITVNKGRDMTSFGVCARLRRLTQTKKTGHTGTLDPMAEGVLVVCLGSAARLLEYMPEKRKRYTAGIRFGLTSDTGDIWGEVKESGKPSFDEAVLRRALGDLTGTYGQKTPGYSARKVNGRPLYSYARSGEEVERPVKTVTVSSIVLTEADLPERAVIDVTCSKGTYIRQLIMDLGDALGCGAVMDSLVRTETDGFTLESARTLEELEELSGSGGLGSVLLPPESLIPDMPSVSVSEKDASRVASGMSVRVQGGVPEGTVKIVSGGRFIAVGQSENGEIKPRKVFLNEDNRRS